MASEIGYPALHAALDHVALSGGWFEGKTMFGILVDESCNFNRATHKFVSDIPTLGEVSVPNYARQEIDGFALSQGASGVDFAATNEVWTNLGGAGPQDDIYKILICEYGGGAGAPFTDNDSGSIVWFKVEAAFKATNGSNFTVAFTSPMARIA